LGALAVQVPAVMSPAVSRMVSWVICDRSGGSDGGVLE
jgi:hypothetical protein